MATEADVAAPVCDTIREEGKNVVDQVANISITKLLQYEKIQADTPNEPPTIEGDNFFRTPSTVEVHCEVSCVLSDVNKVTEKQDAERVENQLSKDTTCEHDDINDPEVENLDVLVRTDEDHSFNITSDDTDQSNMTAEQEGLDNERNIAEKLDSSADAISRENITFSDTIKEATSESDNLQRANQEKMIDAVDRQKEVLQNFSTISNEETEENSMIKMDASEIKNDEHLGKESETTSSQLALARKASDVEASIEEAELREADSCETEKSTETTLLKNEAELEKPNDSLWVASEDVKASDLVLDEKTEDKTVDAAEIKEENEDVSTVGSDEKTEESSMIQVDGSKTEHEANLEKEIEKTSLKQASVDDANDESVVIHEARTGDEKNKDSTQDYKTSASSEEIETACSLEQSLTANPQAIMNERTVDATETQEVTLENVATTVTQEDCSGLEHDEHLGKESGTSSLSEARKEENNEEHEHENRDVINAQLLQNEKYTASDLMKEEAQEEKPIDLSQVATKDVNECYSSQDTKMSFVQKRILTTDAQELPVDKIEERTFDAAETKKETDEGTFEDTAVDVPTGDNEEDNSPTKEDDSQKPSMEEALTCNVNEDDSTIVHDAKFVEESSKKADLYDNENDAKATLIKEGVSIESLQVANEDIKAFASVQDRETSSIEEQSLTVNCEGMMGDHKEKETNDATSLEKETPEDKTVAATIPYEDIKEKSLNQDHCSQMEQTQHLEKESENEKESTSFLKEEQVDKPIASVQVATEYIKASVVDQDTEIGSVKEQIPTTEELLGENTEEKTIDPPPKNEETLENTATLLPHEDTRENSSIQVDFSEKEHEEQLEKESENPSMTEAASEETNEDKSISIQEPENEADDATEVELVENEKCSTSIVVQEEIPLEKPIDFSQVDTDDITESDSCQDTKLRSIKEQILTVDPQGISSNMTEGKHIDAADTKEETLEDNATNGDTESPIEEDGSQKPYLEEDSTLEKNDNESTIKHEAEFVDFSTKKDTENASIKEEVSIESLRVGVAEDIEAFASTQDKETSSVDERSQAVNCEGTIGDQKEVERNDATSVKEETPQDENVGTTIIYEDTQGKSLDQDDCSQKEQHQHLEKESENLSLIKASKGDTGGSNLVMKEVPGETSIDSSRVAIEDNKESAPSQDTKTSSINDLILTTEQNLGDNTEEIIVDPRHTNEETPEQNVATIVPHEDTQENSLIQVDCSEKEHEEHLEEKSESPSTTTDATEETNEDESRNVHECKKRDDDIIKAELLENEKHTASTVGKPVDSSQVDTEDVNEFDSTQDKKISSIEEQILTTDPQEISSDKMEGKTTGAAEKKEETLEEIVANVPSGDNEDTLIKPSLEEASTRDANEDESTIMHEAKYVDESSTKTDLSENAKNIENTLVNEEASIESLQVPAQDIKAFASVQDRETSSLEKQGLSANCQEIIGEHKEHLEKESETPSLTEAPTEKTDDDESKDLHEPDRAELLENENFTVSTLVKEEAHVEEPIDSLKAATEDVEAFDSRQDSSTEEQILITGTKEISLDEIDAIDSKEDTLEDTATNVPNGDEEDNSPIKEDDSQKTSPEEASTHSANEDESTIMHEDKYVDESSIKAGLFENEKNIGDTLVNEEVSEDIKALDSVQITEMSCLKEKSPVADCQGIIGPDTEDKTNDPTTMKEQNPRDENVSTTIPNEDKEEKSLEQGDGSQVEHHENDSEIPSLTEALTGETEESTLITKELELKEPINSSQVASEDNEDIKATVSCQDTEASSIEEQVLTIDPQKIPCDKTEEKIVDAAHTSEENVENIASIVSNEETIERTLVKEEAQVEKLINSFQVASEDIKASTLGPDLEKGSMEEQIQIANLQEISGNNIEEKTIDEVRKEDETFQDMTTNISSGDNEDCLPIKVDEPQVTSLGEVSMGNAVDNEPTITHKAKFADENLTKADSFENEKNTKDTLVKEEVSIETAQVAVQDIETSTLDHVRETCSIEEQSLTSSPQGITGDRKEDKTIDATELKEETPGDKNVATTIPKEDSKKNSIVQVDCSQMEHEESLEKESENSSTTEAPTVKEEITEDTKPSQDTNISSIKETVLTEDPQEISEDNTEERTIDATEIKEETQEVQESEKTTELNEEKDCLNDLQMTTTVSIATHEQQSSDSSAIKIPNANNVEVIVEDPKCKQNESSIPNVSEEHINISNENVANVTSSAFEASEISESSDFVALEEVLPSNVASEEVSTTTTFEEFRREIRQNAENEEAQKQEEDLHVPELIKDSSMENVDKDAHLANAHESDITQEMQKVEEKFSPSPDEKMIGDIIEKTDHKEIEAVEDAMEDKYIEQMEQDDATKSTLHDTEPTESEQKETECTREEVMLGDIVEEIKESTSISVAKDFLPKSSEETSEVETEMKVADTTESTVINNNRSLEDNLTNSRSIVDLETTTADEALAVIETIPNIVEVQEVESRSVGEISGLISQCEKEEYDHASIGSLTEKSDSSEVESAHGENKSEYDSEIKVVEPISQVQSCDIIPQAGEAKTDEENLEAAAETKSEAKDKFETNEAIMVDISSKKVKEENEDAETYHVKEENEDEVIKTANDTEKVLKVSEEADDKAVVEQECTNEEIHGLDHVNTKTGTEDSADGVYSCTIPSLDDGDTIKGVDGVDNELAKDEGSINQNSNTSVLDAVAKEQPKTLDENICEAASIKTDHKNDEQSEGKKGNEDTSMMEHQEEGDQTKHESLPLAELAPEKESDKQVHRDKICSDGANDIPRDNENTTNNGSSEEKCQNKSTESQISSISKDIELIEQASKATTITAEMQETEAGTLSCDVPEQMEVDGRQVKEVSDECKGMAENSASIQPSKISTSVVKQEYKVGTASEAEDQLQELHDLPQESHIVGSEVKMVQGDGPADLHKVTNASEDVSNKENLMEANPNENIDAAVSSEGQVAEAIQKSTASETFEADIQESERTSDKEKMLDNEGSDLIENSCNAVTEMSSQTNIHQSSMEDIAQSDEHAISERDHTKNVNPENSLSKKNISVTQHGSHAGCSQEEGGGEISKPSKQEQEEAHCVHEETRSPAKPKSSDKSETKETCKSSLSDLLQVPVKESPQIAAIEKEPIHTEDLHEEKTDGPELEDAKTDEDESSEQRKSDLGSEALVMVDAGDAEMKGTHKKSHNILSGVGSKVKHSIAKVKKAITGKSSHPKPSSPKEGDKDSKPVVC